MTVHANIPDSTHARTSNVQCHQRVDVAHDRSKLCLFVQFGNELLTERRHQRDSDNLVHCPYLCPVLQADLEHFSVVNTGDLDEIVVRVQQQRLLLWCFDEPKVNRQEIGKEHGQVRDELLVVIVGVIVCGSNIWITRCQCLVEE